MIQEKQRFKQSPVNFAVRKTQLMKEKETAQQRLACALEFEFVKY